MHAQMNGGKIGLIRKYREKKIVFGGTNINAGIRKGTSVLTSKQTRENALRTMVVMTDGQWNKGGDPTRAAVKASENGIFVVTITFGQRC